MRYKTTVHPLWFTVALTNVAILLIPGLVLANKINNISIRSLPATQKPQVQPASANSIEPDSSSCISASAAEDRERFFLSLREDFKI